MNAEKAKELFSEYREGTLNPSLRATLERAMRDDAELASEYARFRSVLDDLESGAGIAVEPPFDLHDRIMARVDKSVFEARRKAKAGWFGNWRLALAGGVAAVAIVGAVVSLNAGQGGPAVADPFPVPGQARLTVRSEDGVLTIHHGAAKTTVVVKEAVSGRLLEKFSLDDKPLDSPITNDGDKATLLSVVSASGELLVAVPGKRRGHEMTGSGTMRDLAVALADVYGEPVVLASVGDSEKVLSWKLATTDPLKAGSQEAGFSVDRRSNGVLYLGD